MSRYHIITVEPERGPILSPSLAAEIGLKSSLILLQIQYWIRKKGHYRDGKLWTYQSVTQLETQFPYIPRTTIRRVINHLVKCGYLHRTSKYNKRKADNTRWYALNYQGLSTLKSIRISKVRETTLSQNGWKELETLSQNELTLSQNEPTLPNYLPTTNKTNVARDAGTQEHTQDEPEDVTQEDLDRFDDLFAEVSEADSSPLLPSFRKREKDLRPIAEPIDDSIQMAMYRLCFRVENSVEALILTSSQRGRVASVLGQLRDAGADFNRIHIFEAWWVKNWRSKDRATQQYQTPRPEQVLEFWVEAMKSDTAPSVIEAHKPAASGINEEALRHAMENRFKRTHE